MSVQTLRATAHNDVDEVVLDTLNAIEIGPITTHRNVSVAPIRLPFEARTIYCGWQEAFSVGSIEVREINKTGMVELLSVTNKSPTKVLLLDGEELCGLKQNRVLGTTVLMPAKSRLTIPVSCSEAGRWSPLDSVRASTPEALMARSGRVNKMRATQRNPKAHGPRSQRYRIDQQQVWASIRTLQQKLGVTSKTEALRDIYIAKKEAIAEYIAAFENAHVGQGIVVWLNGRLVGMELLSLRRGYAAIREQLLRSYIIDALRLHEGIALPAHPMTVEHFIKRCTQGKGRGMRSVGLGVDVRYSGESGFVGSCLVHDSEVVHASFFPAP